MNFKRKEDKMSNIATTISQSRKLIELGLSPNSADMVWMCNKWLYSIEDNILNKTDFNEQDTLAWSLTALLDVMPKPDLYRETADLWVCVTLFKEGSIRGFGETAIDATYDVITKMFERGYLKKKGGER
jgi:hypothetical protein